MATTYKILGQSNPSAQTATDLYTVPASTQAVVSTLSICNLDSTNTAFFRVATRRAGATLANSQYIAYNTSLSPLDTISLTMGVTLGNTDVITVYANSASLSFSAFGSEIT
jgi:hypothetical protein